MTLLAQTPIFPNNPGGSPTPPAENFPPADLIKDIQPTIAPTPTDPLIYWLAASIVVLSLGLLLIWLLRRPKPSTPLSPLQIARQRIAQLRQDSSQHASAQFSAQASHILRQYLEGQYQLCAPQQTTEEFLQHSQTRSILQPTQQSQLQQILQLCDQAKFASTSFGPEEQHTLLQNIEQFMQPAAHSDASASTP